MHSYLSAATEQMWSTGHLHHHHFHGPPASASQHLQGPAAAWPQNPSVVVTESWTARTGSLVSELSVQHSLMRSVGAMVPCRMTISVGTIVVTVLLMSVISLVVPVSATRLLGEDKSVVGRKDEDLEMRLDGRRLLAADAVGVSTHEERKLTDLGGRKDGFGGGRGRGGGGFGPGGGGGGDPYRGGGGDPHRGGGGDPYNGGRGDPYHGGGGDGNGGDRGGNHGGGNQGGGNNQGSGGGGGGGGNGNSGICIGYCPGAGSGGGGGGGGGSNPSVASTSSTTSPDSTKP